MSVPTWKRKLSGAEYVYQLYQLNIRLGEILVNKPQKYKQNYTDEIIQTALSALKHAQTADSIFLGKYSREKDFLIRREQLLLAKGEVQHVATACFIFLEIVRRHDLFLFSDEVYREFIYTGSPYISACHLEGIENNVILIDSVSKRYSECGIRIGALVTKNVEVRKAVMKFCQARLSPPLIGQIVAEASLDAPEEYLRDVYDEYVERRKCLIDGLNRIPGVYSPIPMGAFYTVAKLPVDSAEEFCRWCLSEFNYEGETVMMAPAAGFYTTPGAGINQVRIAYVLKKKDLERALFVLRKALEAYPGRVDEQ